MGIQHAPRGKKKNALPVNVTTPNCQEVNLLSLDDDSTKSTDSSVTKPMPVANNTCIVETNTSEQKIIKQKGDGSYVSNMCDFCDKFKSNHYCLEQKTNSMIMLEGRKGQPDVCGLCICVMCREKWGDKHGDAEKFARTCLNCFERKHKESPGEKRSAEVEPAGRDKKKPKNHDSNKNKSGRNVLSRNTKKVTNVGKKKKKVTPKKTKVTAAVTKSTTQLTCNSRTTKPVSKRPTRKKSKSSIVLVMCLRYWVVILTKD